MLHPPPNNNQFFYTWWYSFKLHCSVTCSFSREIPALRTKDANNDSLMVFALCCLPHPLLTSPAAVLLLRTKLVATFSLPRRPIHLIIVNTQISNDSQHVVIREGRYIFKKEYLSLSLSLHCWESKKERVRKQCCNYSQYQPLHPPTNLFFFYTLEWVRLATVAESIEQPGLQPLKWVLNNI